MQAAPDQQSQVERKVLANYSDADGMPLLVNAVYSSNVEAVGLMLLAGADPNVRDGLGCSVLEHACCTSNAKIIALLVRMGANVNGVRSSSGDSLQEVVEGILNVPVDHFQSQKPTEPEPSRSDPFMDLDPAISFPSVNSFDLDDMSDGELGMGEDYMGRKPKSDTITLSKPLDVSIADLQSACCKGDVKTISRILHTRVPILLESLERSGPDVLMTKPRAAAGKVEKVEKVEVTTEPTEVITKDVKISADIISPKPRPAPHPHAHHKPLAQTQTRSTMSTDTMDTESSDDEADSMSHKIVPTPSETRHTVRPEEIDLMMQEQCDELREFFESLSAEDAEMVLRNFTWDLDLQKIGDLMCEGENRDENYFREVSGLHRTDGKLIELPKVTRACDICTETKSALEFLSLGCQHVNICSVCWRTYLTNRASEGVIECLKSPCIGHTSFSKCNLVVPRSFFARHADPDTVKIFNRRREEEFVMNNKRRVLAYCPGPDCGRVCCADMGMKVKDVVARSFLVTCPCPMGTFCMGCVKVGDLNHKAQPHAPASCKNVSDWIKKTTEEGRFFTFRVKHCPNRRCNAAIVKCGCQGKVICNALDHCPNQACNHMQCKNCNTHFCWICCNLWEDHNNYYQCNKQLSADLTPIEFFKGCLERYDDHMKSFRNTRDRTELSSKMFEYFHSKRPACMQTDVFTESNEEMAKSYVILANSYVRRHYTKFAHDAEKNLYEMQQGMLEMHTTKLMEKYEIFKKKFDIQSEELDIQDEVIKMREYAKLLKTFRKNMVESFSLTTAADGSRE